MRTTRLLEGGGGVGAWGGGTGWGLRRSGAGPDYFEGGFVLDQVLGVASYANGQGVFGVGADFAQAFFFGLQALVWAIKRDAEVVRAGGERVLDMERLGAGVQACSEQQVMVGEDGQGSFGDAGIDIDVQ